ncbi:MAG: hypothetical protein NVSMB9_30160 [Isosphaeraceae bacterium]
MAALAHGVSTVTNVGRLTEPIWAESGGVGLASGTSADELARTTERLLADSHERQRIARMGRSLHDDRFAVGWTVDAIVGTVPRVSP